MWPKIYRDYPVDKEQLQQKVEPGHGIIGCEMHETHGWGLENHRYRHRSGAFAKFFVWLFGEESSDE